MTLIPKVKSPLSVKEFRPISMVGCLYKIITKILARRLKYVMGMIIFENQTGFIELMNIIDGLITANASVQWLKDKKELEALFKIDFRKAYDSLRWSFLEHMLQQIGLARNMVRWILWCVTTVSI